VFPTFDAGRQTCASAHGDGGAGVLELEAAGESSEDRLVLEQRELHADADSGTFREGEEAAPTAVHLVCGGDPVLSRCAVLGFCGITAADKPACGAEDIAIAEDGFVTVDANQGNVDNLALLDRDRFDQRTVSTANGMAEGDDIVLLNDLLSTDRRREHANGLFAHGIEVGEAVRVHQVVVSRFASDRADFLAEPGLDVRVLRKRPCGESKRRGCCLVAGKAV
jgi:hypothetical protein